MLLLLRCPYIQALLHQAVKIGETYMGLDTLGKELASLLIITLGVGAALGISGFLVVRYLIRRVFGK